MSYPMYVYKQPLRQAEDFLSSLFDINGINLKVPCYTTISRRKQTLNVRNKLRKWNKQENIVFAIDGSGLKCCGEKEWRQTQQRRVRRRKFTKIHVGVDVKSRYVLFSKSTQSNVSAISVLSEALNEVECEIHALLADGGYDSKNSYKLTHPETKVIIPPRSNAVKDNKTHQRNQSIEYIKKHSKARWKREYGYHMRALVENVFSRWKTIFGENIKSKIPSSQQAEVTLKSFILNKMTDLGMPEWKRIYHLF